MKNAEIYGFVTAISAVDIASELGMNKLTAVLLSVLLVIAAVRTLLRKESE